MDVEAVREHCMSMPLATEDFPFDADTLAIRIGGKIFALLPLEKRGLINLKCDPERAILLREEYSAITPGYHMHKASWNTLRFGELPQALVKELIQHSYNLVRESLPRKVKSELGI
jgi:predicted DNA-binding protein (MmcQ/YjbR family)